MLDQYSSSAEFFAALGIPLIISLVGTGLSIPLAKRFHIMDAPGNNKVHSEPMPRFGGLGIVLGVVISSVVLYDFSVMLLIGAITMALTGVIDDRYTIGPGYKIFGQLTSGFFFAVYIWEGSENLTTVLTGLFAIILVLGLSNAVNLLDGLNGLAAGTSLISISGLALLLHAKEQTSLPALIMVGALTGFLIWNFPRAKTFMGDTGSLFIGYIIAILLMELAKSGINTFLIGVLMTGIPVFDTCLGIIRRIVNRRPLFEADRGHFYDVINRRLKSPVKTVLIIYAISLILVICGMFAQLTGYVGGIIVIFLGIVSLIAMFRRLIIIIK